MIVTILYFFMFLISCERKYVLSRTIAIENNTLKIKTNKEIEKLFSKKHPFRNFGLLDKNLFSPDEYNMYRKIVKIRQQIQKEKLEQAQRMDQMLRNKVFRAYLLPVVGGSFLKDFNHRF
jgi:hypothetical protein